MGGGAKAREGTDASEDPVFEARGLGKAYVVGEVELVTEIAREPMSPAEALALMGMSERIDRFSSQLSGGE